MQVILHKIDGLDDALVALRMSKQHSDHDKELEIRTLVAKNLLSHGKFVQNPSEEFEKELKTLFKWGTRHITLLKFIDLSFSVYGLHRGGQDDMDAHAKRMDNRIIRASTRLSKFPEGAMSAYYKGKIIPTDVALKDLGIEVPESFEKDGKTYVKTTNGYVAQEYKDNQDVLRGLYMLSIPSSFIFDANLAEFAHIYQMRNSTTSAHPEVKECVEEMLKQLGQWSNGWISRELLMGIKN